MKRAKEILFIADVWDTLDHARDSTLHLGRVAREEFGLRCFWVTPENVFYRDGKLFARLTGTLVDDKLQASSSAERALESFASVHWRADPPVTEQTLRLWSLLAAAAGKTRFLNPPSVLLGWNEKFAPLRFGQWAIPSLVSDDEGQWERFFNTCPSKKIIAKPVSEAASRGVELLPTTWPQARERLRALRQAHGAWLVLQEFDPKIESKGETRVFILGRKILATVQKTPKPGHPITNLDLEESARPTLTLAGCNTTQKKRAETIAKLLAKEGGHLATIDFIGERILEINVTSPGMIAWVDARFEGKQRLAYRYWALLQ